jgi:hypothetical protein
LGEPSGRERASLSTVTPGTVGTKSPLARGDRSGPAAEAELTAVKAATVAARSSVVFISFIFLLRAALSRVVHALGYATGRSIPQHFSTGEEKKLRA